MPDDGALEPQQLVDLLETYLLGSPATFTGPQVAEAVGMDLERAKDLWRSLGFTDVPDDEVAFNAADLEALRRTEHLHALGVVEAGDELALIRTLGRSFAKLAEWQLNILGNLVNPATHGVDEGFRVVDDVLPNLEALQGYIWRRHLLGVASRLLLAPQQDDAPSIVVGFADIVGYTRQSRAMTREELGRLVEDLERQALAIIAEHGGRIVKTIGDEVMFVLHDPAEGAEVGLQLIELHQQDEDFPELRVGLAYGQVLARFGDVFGPTVNIAARLTSIARPGKVLIDRHLAAELAEDTRFWTTRARRQPVKGYRLLESWKLRRFDENQSSPAAYLQQMRRDLLRAVDEVQHRLEGTPAAEGVE